MIVSSLLTFAAVYFAYFTFHLGILSTVFGLERFQLGNSGTVRKPNLGALFFAQSYKTLVVCLTIPTGATLSLCTFSICLVVAVGALVWIGWVANSGPGLATGIMFKLAFAILRLVRTCDAIQ